MEQPAVSPRFIMCNPFPHWCLETPGEQRLFRRFRKSVPMSCLPSQKAEQVGWGFGCPHQFAGGRQATVRPATGVDSLQSSTLSFRALGGRVIRSAELPLSNNPHRSSLMKTAVVRPATVAEPAFELKLDCRVSGSLELRCTGCRRKCKPAKLPSVNVTC